MSTAQLKLIATSNVTGSDVTKTISDINPEAGYRALKTFAQNLNNLTLNTYVKSNLVVTTNIDSEAYKTVPTLAFTYPTATVTAMSSNVTTSNSYSYIFTYNGDATIDQFYITGDLTSMNLMAVIEGSDGTFSLVFKRTTSGNISPGVITLHVPETDDYQAATATFTVTA